MAAVSHATAAGMMTPRTAAATVRWVTWLLVVMIMTQRLAVPGTVVPLLLPIVLAWATLALRAGVLELDLRRLAMWCTASAVTAFTMLLQTQIHPGPVISPMSWALIVVVWLPAVCRFVDRRASTYRQVLRRTAHVCAALAAACVFMLAIQLLGVPYRDIVADVVPAPFLQQSFTTTSPVEFGSPIYRANAWIGLEAASVSFEIGFGLLAAILVRCSRWILVLLITGLCATVAGSGYLIVAVGLVAMLALPARRLLLPYLLPLGVVAAVLASTPFGQILITRAGGASEDRSASLRAVRPYLDLWPSWSSDLVTALIGGGAGSSQRLMDLGVFTALVPVPAKLFYDYGLIAGGVLAFFLIFCYLDSPSATLAFTFFVSLWTVQPGSNTAIFVVPVLMLVTFWAPRAGPRIEELSGAPPAQPAGHGS